jgi:hypothetical protein
MTHEKVSIEKWANGLTMNELLNSKIAKQLRDEKKTDVARTG